MKWNKENKEKLLLALRLKADKINQQAHQEGGLSGWHDALTRKTRGFLSSFGLRMFADESNCRKYGWGLQIPKEVAKKFLILGVP